jgi:hypothetical protein
MEMATASESRKTARGSSSRRSSSSGSTKGSTRSASSRGRQQSGTASRNGRSAGSNGQTRAQSGGSGRSQSNGSGRSRPGGSGSKASTGAARSRSTKKNNDHEGIATLGLSLAGTAIGLAGGVLLGKRVAGAHRRVLGIPVPDKIELGDVAENLGEAGRQFGRLAGEVRAVRQKAEQIGRILT